MSHVTTALHLHSTRRYINVKCRRYACTYENM